MRLFLLLIVTHLAGCSTLVYQEPASGDRARVRFVTDLNSIAVVRVYDDENCVTNENEWLRLKNGWLLNSTPKRMGMPNWHYHENAAKEVYVATDKQFNALISSAEQVGGINYSCAVPVVFRFQKDTDYEVSFQWARENCSVSIYKLASIKNFVDSTKVGFFNNVATEKTRGCMAAFKKPRLY